MANILQVSYFANLLKLLGEWNNSKIWGTMKLFANIG